MRKAIAALSLALMLGGAVPGAVLAVAPSISSFTPASGALWASVTINGTDLGGATAVKFNGVTAPINSNTAIKITTIVPIGASTGPISVTTPGGTATSAANFTVTLGIVSASVYAQPGETIKVSGAGFSASRAVDLYLDGTLRALAATTAQGTFSNINLKIRKSAKPGAHTISAVDRATGLIAQRNVKVFTNWPQFRGSPKHRGRNSLENIISPANVGNLEQAWVAAATGSFVFSSPAVANGMVYVGSADRKLYAFAAAGCVAPPCAPLWSSTPTGGYIFSSPAVANGVVYVGSTDDKLYAFAVAGCGAATCAPLWSAATGGDIYSSPAVVNGVVYVGSGESYVGSGDGRLHAFAAGGCGAANCEPLWSAAIGAFATGGDIFSSPAVANGVVYLGSQNGKLYAFAAAGCGAATCAPLWSAATGGAMYSSPAVANGVVYVGSGDSKLYAFAAAGCGAATCAPLWSAASGGLIQSSPAVANGVVYVGSYDTKLYAFAAAGCGAATCAPLWSAATGGVIHSSPAVANGVVYVGSSDTKLHAFAAAGCGAANCAPLWSAATGADIFSSPAVVNGVVYVGSYDNKLYAFDLSGDSGVTSPLP